MILIHHFLVDRHFVLLYCDTRICQMPRKKRKYRNGTKDLKGTLDDCNKNYVITY